MFFVCQSIGPSSLRGSENQAIFATRSPTAIRTIRPFRPRRKQMPETSRSGTSTTRRTRSWFLFDLPFFPMGEGLSAHQGEHTTIARGFPGFLLNLKMAMNGLGQQHPKGCTPNLSAMSAGIGSDAGMLSRFRTSSFVRGPCSGVLFFVGFSK
jgi:hypothetical protein